jgi:hypothetical protein
MIDILLSSPVFYLYLAFVVVLLIAALWTRQPGPAVGKPRAAAPTTGRASATLWWQHVATSTGSPGGAPPRNPGATARPFSDLQATLSATYAVELEQAIRTIRVGAPLEARPIERAAG